MTSFTARYQNLILCGRCNQPKPILGSSGGGPNRRKRICSDCRDKFSKECMAEMWRLRGIGVSYRKTAEMLALTFKPSPTPWLIEKWCKELQ